MKFIVFIIAILSIINMIEAQHHNLAMPRNYVKNINKAIVNMCNMEAHKQIQDDEIYTCYKNKMSSCTKLANYSKFNAIRAECIKNKGSDYGYGIVIAIMMWVVLSIFWSH